jgi:hypothetical protein
MTRTQGIIRSTGLLLPFEQNRRSRVISSFNPGRFRHCRSCEKRSIQR